MLEATAAELEQALHEHGVAARLTRIVPGPTVTRYEIELAPGVKVSRVTGLSHDIAYALASPDVRILAPIPGKSAIGIEVPNRHRQLVTLGDILASPEVAADHDPLAVALGKDIAGAARLLHLEELPHLIIAGATGAGKSSCINAMVTSILMRTTPEEVRLILVDPKRVELGQYNDVPHLLTRVITNPKKASDALQWAVSEMERRYELLADAGVRDITSYREKWDAGGLDEGAFDRFPFIVIIVDELNDLMMVAGRAVEDSVVRIAQMARAVGIHLVLATQRPSVNVITGVIKANVPSRLAFSVASQTDSRVIIDSVGAEKLVGLGDMLVVTALNPKPERIQGAFVTEKEIHSVVDWVREQQRARYQDKHVFEVAEKQVAEDDMFEGEDPQIIRQALELIVRSQLGSTSMLQRKLRIGFARAGRVMDILERKGIVGPSEGSKARAVLITEDELPDLLAMAGSK
jgi:S-DNA-T family DNA segregation ATPase FtsK/SpoIIIE